MALSNLSFMVLLCCTVIVYYIVPGRRQWLVLLLASAVFYLSFGVGQSAYVLVTAGVSYAAGRLLGGLNAKLREPGCDKPMLKRKKRIVMWAAVALDLGLLVVLKYSGMLFPGGRGLIVPLGISFYTLSALAYIIDIYRTKYEPERNPFKLLLCIASFLQIVQGPFVRYNQMMPELTLEHHASYDDIKLGALRFLWGQFKKTVIADWLGVYVASAMGAPEAQGSAAIAIAMVIYSLQMYADFSGYMDIVCGAGRMLGIRMPENFDRPLGAKSVAEFWRRWHMTLSAWFRDYVFYPVSISKPAVRLAKHVRKGGNMRLAKLTPSLMSMLAVWPLTGLWHGAGTNYLLWGVLNGLVMAFSMLMEPRYEAWLGALHIDPKGRFWRAFSVVRTFMLLSVIRVFARTGSVGEAFGVIGALGNGLNGALSLTMLFPFDFRKMHMAYVAAAFVFAAVMLVVESRGSTSELLDRFNRFPLWAKYVTGIVLIYVVILFSATGEAISSTFLYANF